MFPLLGSGNLVLQIIMKLERGVLKRCIIMLSQISSSSLLLQLASLSLRLENHSPITKFLCYHTATQIYRLSGGHVTHWTDFIEQDTKLKLL